MTMATDPGTTTQPDNLVEHLLDLAVYLPVGLFLDSKGRVDEIVDRGRAHTTNQVSLARMIGKFAVTFGRKELERRLAGLFPSTPDGSESGRPAPAEPEPGKADSPARAAVAAGAARPANPSTTRPQNPSKPAPSKPTRGRAAGARGSALGIEGYDTLAASQVIARLDGLTARQLQAVGRHEGANRNRKTILGRVEQLTAR